MSMHWRLQVVSVSLLSIYTNSTVAGTSLRVIARCGASCLAMALRPAEGGRLRHAETVHEVVDLIQVLYGSCNGESCGILLLSVAYVSHELHARKTLDEDDL